MEKASKGFVGSQGNERYNENTLPIFLEHYLFSQGEVRITNELKTNTQQVPKRKQTLQITRSTSHAVLRILK